METESTLSPIPKHRLNKLHEIKLPLWVSLVLLVLLLVVFAWQSFAVAQAERRLEAERHALIEQQNDLQAAAAQAMKHADNRTRQWFGTALAWAVRAEMIRGNLDQIDQYFSALVRTHGLALALLVDPTGKVLVASDRAYVDKPLPAGFSSALLQADSFQTVSGEDGSERMAIPIHGLNARIGTVILVLQPAADPAKS
ncbi:hypothetical protein [Pseudothauera hydrothermalis]|uniref:hypothetical protein n=1 Tax=Pseudothauera hydrothermalis TaxID=2184083 RepID=UPI000E094232|nr:hypothetical protein [Pseudothauera hydrothermalis]